MFLDIKIPFLSIISFLNEIIDFFLFSIFLISDFCREILVMDIEKINIKEIKRKKRM